MDAQRRLLWISGGVGILLIVALVVAFFQLSGLREDVNALKVRVDENFRRGTAVLAEKQRFIDGLRGDAGKNGASLDALRQDLGKLRIEFFNMKPELAGAAAKAITKEIIDAATTQAITQAVQELASTGNGKKFIEQLAKELAISHRTEIAGSPGKDADDERVASFLAARADFIDAVCVSILQLQEERSK
jgi:hypothetical protein